MNNFYYKIALTSVCTALSFTLGGNKEVKAATFNLTPASAFYTFEINATNREEADGYLAEETLSVGREYTSGSKGQFVNEYRALYEFNIANLFLPSDAIISSAIFYARVVRVSSVPYYSWLQIYGYKGDGEITITDHSVGDLLEEKVFRFINEKEPMQTLEFNVLPFINQKITNNDTFVGFKIQAPKTYPWDPVQYISLDRNASLIIQTQPVPEPTTIFGSALALGVGGWLKRKKLNQQRKKTS